MSAFRQLIAQMLTETQSSQQSWAQEHYRAWKGFPGSDWSARAELTYNRERAVRKAIEGWSAIAESHQDLYGTPIGDDAMMGKEFARMGRALRVMLTDGELCRFDGGTIDRLLYSIANEAHIDLDDDDRELRFSALSSAG